MSWRVKVKYGYNDIYFTFEDVEEAAYFCTTMLVAFDKEMSYDKKDLYVSMTPFDPEKENNTDEED